MQKRASVPVLESIVAGSRTTALLAAGAGQAAADLLILPVEETLNPEKARRDRLDDLLMIQEYERKRLGRELHDSAGQLLISLQMGISRFRAVAEKAGQGELIDEIRETIQQIDAEIRSLAFLQYPAELGDKGVCNAIQTLANGFGRRTGIPTTFKCVGDPAPVDPATSLSLLRVTQEALANVHRHAHASLARVVLERRPGSMTLSVSDDGRGISAEAAAEAHGIGLPGMRHRIESLGGKFTVGRLKHGTKISASVPLAA